MKRKLLIIGTGGEGREAAWIARRMMDAGTANWDEIEFLDDNSALKGQFINGIKVGGTTADLDHLNLSEIQIVAAIGYPDIRRKVIDRICKHHPDLEWANLIDPSSLTAENTNLGRGIILSPFAAVSVNCTIKDYVLIGTGAIIGHDTQIESFSSVFPGVCLSGNVKISEQVLIGTGAKVIQGLSIGPQSVIGAGAAVIRNLPEAVVAAGVPCTIKRYLDSSVNGVNL